MSLPALVKDWPVDWREAFEERAAIMEFDAGMSRAEAERAAEASTREAYADGLRVARQARGGDL